MRKEVLQDSEESLAGEDMDLKELGKQAGIDTETLIDALGASNDFLAPDEVLEGLNDDTTIEKAVRALEAQNNMLQDHVNKFMSVTDTDKMTQEGYEELITSLKLLPRYGIDKSDVESASKPSIESSIAMLHQEQENQAKRQNLESPKKDRTMKSLGVNVNNFPLEYQGDVRMLGDFLYRATRDSGGRKSNRFTVRKTTTPSAKLWKYYIAARPGLQASPNNESVRIWQTLWNHFASDHSENYNRMQRLCHLGNDMWDAGVRLDNNARILHLEAVCVTGDRTRAIRLWERAGETGTFQSSEELRSYRALGIRMFCLEGDTERAVLLARSMIAESADVTDYRILIPIIKVCLQEKSAAGTGRAWNMYKQLRVGLGDRIEMADYDALTHMFLKSNQANLALQIFTDMMLTGESTTLQKDEDSSGLTDDVPGYSLVQEGRSVFRVEDPQALAPLPPAFKNKVFFGSWTKKLIGDGDLDGVMKVFELMQDRGICPLPIHMNGLIGAWFRQGSENYRQCAEELAWRMINARISYALERQHMSGLVAPARTVSVGGPGLHKSLPLYTVPFATMETFTILLQQYRRRQRHDQFPVLFDALNRAKIPVDTVFINELLWIDTRSHHKGWVWQTYQSLMDSKAAMPDFITYAILWQNMKKQEDPVIGRKPESSSANFTTCRLLFQDMIKRTAYLRGRGKEMRRELYELIVLCFCYSRDVEATAVALRSLQHHFNVYPNVDTARSVIVQLARLGLIVQWKQDRRLLRNPSGEQRVQEVTQIFELLKERRSEVLEEHGLVFDELSPELKQEESLTLLLDLLRYAFDSRRGNNKLIESSSRVAAERAAAEMSVPECNPWTDGKESVHV